VGYELRLDYLQDFSQLESQLHQMLTRLHSPQTIATCRMAAAGGKFQGTLADQAAILSAAVRAGCQWVDVEIESVQKGGVALFKEFKPAKIIVSYHDFQKTPALASIYRRMARLPVQVVKIATTARYLKDNLQTHRLLKAHGRHSLRLVALAMGPSGIPSRLLSLLWGSAFTYASPLNHSPAAAGQIPAEVMRSVYRVERLDSRTHLPDEVEPAGRHRTGGRGDGCQPETDLQLEPGLRCRWLHTGSFEGQLVFNVVGKRIYLQKRFNLYSGFQPAGGHTVVLADQDERQQWSQCLDGIPEFFHTIKIRRKKGKIVSAPCDPGGQRLYSGRATGTTLPG